jgi:hypothetical protein
MEELDFQDEHKPVLPTWEPAEWQGRRPAEVSWSTTLTAGIGALMVILSVWIYFSK